MATLAGHPYITRAEWGARPPTDDLIAMVTPSPRLWVHHSATEQHGAPGVRAIQLYHQTAKGWKDIAYNLLIDDDGTIYEGRGIGIIGGATAGDNPRSHAVCLLGNFENRKPTDDMIDTLVDLARLGRELGWWTPTLGGHRDAPGASTACPGDWVYEQLPDIRRQVNQPAPPIPAPIPVPEETDMFLYKGPGPAVFFCAGGVSVGLNEGTDLATFRDATPPVPEFTLDDDTFKKFRERFPGA